MLETARQPRWYWLLPLTYVIHIAEEYFGGFVEWSARTSGSGLDVQGFLVLTTIGGLLTATGVYLSGRWRLHGWIPITMATIFTINSVQHLISTVTTSSYSPGLFSGLLIWMPLGLLVLHRAYRDHSAAMLLKSAAVGILIQGAISLGLRLS